MGFLGSLLTNATSGLAAYRQGQAAGEKERYDRQQQMRKAMLEEALLDLRKQSAERQLRPYDPSQDPEILQEEAKRSRGLGSYAPKTPPDPYGGRTRDQYFEDQDQLERIRHRYDTPPAGSVQATDQGLVVVDPRTGRARPVAGPNGQALQRPPHAAGAGRPTQFQNQAGLQAPRAREGLQLIEGYIAKNKGVPATSFLGRVTGGQYATPEEVQAYNQAAALTVMAILRVDTGAAITKDEVQQYTQQFIPQPGDKPQVVQQKLTALRSAVARLEAAAAGAGSAGGRPAMDEPEPDADGYSPDNPFAPQR